MTLVEKSCLIRVLIYAGIIAACVLFFATCDSQIRIKIEITDEPAKEAK